MTARLCEALVVPIKERKMRPCGQPATGKVGRRHLCEKHLTHARKREAGRG